jgi:DNA primase
VDREHQQELIQEIREKNDIVAVISEYVTLRRSGRSLLGLCPFHSEKTSSFNVNEEKQFYYCFGCSQGGDVFSFIMKKEGLEFFEAARRLADRAGILWPEEEAASAAGKEREEYLRINKLATAFFNHCLLKTKTGKPALDYLQERGITPATAERFGLGYAPADWHTLTEIFRRKEVDLTQAERLGLIGSGENGYYDRFRDRVIFPISDAQGRIVGFGGRAFGSAGEPKYLNSPESPFFHKGHFWFGLNLAKESIRKTGQAIIVEGYLDAIQAHQAGFSQAVASLGTALTREQARILVRFAKDAVLAYDADAAFSRPGSRSKFCRCHRGTIPIPSSNGPGPTPLAICCKTRRDSLTSSFNWRYGSMISILPRGRRGQSRTSYPYWRRLKT